MNWQDAGLQRASLAQEPGDVVRLKGERFTLVGDQSPVIENYGGVGLGGISLSLAGV